MKIAIIGAGAMGCLYAGYLSKDNEVILLDTYFPQVETINQKGIVIEENDQTKKHYYPKAYMSNEYQEHVDLVLVFVKGIYTYTACKMNQKLFNQDTLVMTLQNGAGNSEEISRFVQAENIIVGTTSHNCVSKKLGEVYHSGVGPSNIGAFKANEKMLEKLALVKQVFDQANLPVNILEDIQTVLWKKLFVNCSINGLSTIVNTKINEVYVNSFLHDLMLKILHECVQVAALEKQEFNETEIIQYVEEILLANKTGIASMCQDRRARRLTEIDRINGYIVQRAKEHNVEVPFNEMLCKLVHALEVVEID